MTLTPVRGRDVDDLNGAMERGAIDRNVVGGRLQAGVTEDLTH